MIGRRIHYSICPNENDGGWSRDTLASYENDSDISSLLMVSVKNG